VNRIEARHGQKMRFTIRGSILFFKLKKCVFSLIKNIVKLSFKNYSKIVLKTDDFPKYVDICDFINRYRRTDRKSINVIIIIKFQVALSCIRLKIFLNWWTNRLFSKDQEGFLLAILNYPQTFLQYFFSQKKHTKWFVFLAFSFPSFYSYGTNSSSLLLQSFGHGTQ